MGALSLPHAEAHVIDLGFVGIESKGNVKTKVGREERERESMVKVVPRRIRITDRLNAPGFEYVRTLF